MTISTPAVRILLYTIQGGVRPRAGPVLLFLLCILLACPSCRNAAELPEEEAFEGTYAAEVLLDSTRLLVTEIASGLEAPRDITAGPDGWIWVNEIRGSLWRVNPDTGEKQKLLKLPDVFFERARGLLSTALHPEFEEHPYVYLHYTFAPQELGSRIVRYTFSGDTLVDRQLILDNLPGGSGHSGSKMMAGPDGKLWLATGDAHQGHLAQSHDSYHGKVLRMNFDGSVPEDNPVAGSRIWTTGHRNVQGITHGNGNIYISEHGPANDDEVNLLRKGGNYGWPDVQGFCDSEAEREYCRDSLIVEPLVAFNPVVAPAGVAWYGHDAIPEWKNSLLLTSLRIQTLRILHLDEDGDKVEDIRIFFQQHFGRLRDVTVDGEGRIFLLTSNTDWYRESRPDIHDPELARNGDRILMIRRADETLLSLFEGEDRVGLTENQVPLYLGDSEIADDMGAGERLYMAHCAGCHLPDGSGMGGIVPPLAGSERVSGSRAALLGLMLDGIPAGERNDGYEWEMPVYASLSDDEIAAILNFVRERFSSEPGHFRPEDVRESRGRSTASAAQREQ